MDAGKLRERISILTITEDNGNFSWTERNKSWAMASVSGKPAIFAKAGASARRVDFTMRNRQHLKEGDMILWNREYYLISSIAPIDRLFDEVSTARVRVFDCSCDGVRFPAVMTEKFVRYAEMNPYAMNVETFVLVTPKQVTLRRGSLVTVEGTPYEIITGHELDEWKNEYEITRTVDL